MTRPHPHNVKIDGCWFEAISAADLNSDQLRAYQEEWADVPKEEIAQKLRDVQRAIDSTYFALHSLEQKRMVLVYAHEHRPTSSAPPALKTFDLWMEGYRATGDHGTAQYLGKVEAKTFQEACDVFCKERMAEPWLYDATRRTYWGCQIFDNEADARKRFG
jgi:hypothetical protein